MSHTPRQWVPSGQLIVGPPRAHPNPKARATRVQIASVCWDYDGDHGATEPRINWKEAEANQLLMCAAPDLLAAAEKVIACGALPRERHLCEAIRELENAVKKAKEG